MDGADITPDLIKVDVDDALQALLDQFPLPHGIRDADMNQEEIAAALSTTVNTIAKWIKTEGLPVAQQGGNGRAYVLRLSHCWAWKRAREADVDRRTQHNRAQIGALQAEFLGIEVDDPMSQLTAKQRLELANADAAWSRAKHLRRQLVQLDEVVDLLESINKIVRDGIEALPDRLERELGLKPEQVSAVVRAGTDVLQAMADRIEAAELREREIGEVEVQTQWVI